MCTATRPIPTQARRKGPSRVSLSPIWPVEYNGSGGRCEAAQRGPALVYVDPRTADVPALADYVARWLDGLRDWCPRCQGTGREDFQDPYSPHGSCSRCLGKLWIAVIDVERLLEAIALVGPLEVEFGYPGRGSRECLLRLHGDHRGEDESTVGAVYRAAAALVKALLDDGVLKEQPFDDTGH